jgi:hypothetical protein
MPDLASFGLLAFAAGVFALGGFVKGVVGLGLPTIAMGLLSLRMAPAQAAALLLVPRAAGRVRPRWCGAWPRCCSACASACGPAPVG